MYYGYDVGLDRIAVFNSRPDLEQWIKSESTPDWRYALKEQELEDYFDIDRNLYDFVVEEDGVQYIVLGNTFNVFRAIAIVDPKTQKFNPDRFASGVASILSGGKSKYIMEKLLIPAMLEEARYEIEESFWENAPSCDIDTLDRVFTTLGTSTEKVIVESVLKYTEQLFRDLLQEKSKTSA